jgi:hypothetical protein
VCLVEMHLRALHFNIELSDKICKGLFVLILKPGSREFKPLCLYRQSFAISHQAQLFEHTRYTGSCRSAAVDTEPLRLYEASNFSSILVPESAESTTVWSWLWDRLRCSCRLRQHARNTCCGHHTHVLLLLYHVLLLLHVLDLLHVLLLLSLLHILLHT